MVQQLGFGALILVCIVGCGASESPGPVDTPAQRAAVEQSASQAWTPDKQEAYRSAMQRARDGSEGNGVAPASGGGYSQGGSGVTMGGMPQANAPDTSTYSQPTQGGGEYYSQPGPTNSSSAPTSGRPSDIGSTGSDPMVGK